MRNRFPHRTASLLISLLVIFSIPILVKAQSGSPTSVTDDEVNSVARELYCPVCENIPLDVCGTQACAQWRELIRQKLEAGWSKDQIKVYFVEQYGDRVLATPPARGFNWLIYLFPPLLILLGGIILYRSIKIWKAAPPARENPNEEVPLEKDPYFAQIEDELKKR